jgi:hypothetical protein
MSRPRIGLISGLLAIGLMGVVAEGSQAAKWLILDSGGTALDAASLSASVAVTDANPELLTELFKIFFVVKCTKGESIGANLLSEGKITTGVKGKFTGCTAYTNAALNKNCTPHSPGAASGTVETAELKGALVLHEAFGGTGLVRVEPKIGTTLATLEMSGTCPVGTKIPINGVYFFKDAELETHKVSHSLTEGPLTDLWVTATKNAEHAARIHILSTASLTGFSHGGLAWSGMPE